MNELHSTHYLKLAKSQGQNVMAGLMLYWLDNVLYLPKETKTDEEYLVILSDK